MTFNQGYSYRHVLGPRAVGHSALSYLTCSFTHSTESEWQGRLEAGEVLLDGSVAKGQEVLLAGKLLVWNRPAWIEADTPQAYRIIYHDDQLLAVDKPSGLPTIPGAGFFSNTLLNFVIKDFPEARPLHRLGRATSGLVLFALDAKTASRMSAQWTSVRKQYQALGSFVASQDSYDIQSPIGLCDHPRIGKVHAACQTGKPSRSVARTLERRTNTTLFEVDLHSGRPHQIRIHLAFIGHPLVGDPLYAIGGAPILDHPGLPGDAGYVLHAKRLTFQHPSSGHPIDLIAELPEILCTHVG